MTHKSSFITGSLHVLVLFSIALGVCAAEREEVGFIGI